MKLYLLGVAVLVASCQSAGATWVAMSSQDLFTDVNTKMVTVGSLPSRGMLFTQSLHYYPFVGFQNNELYVGIRSGGAYRVPTGTVEIRIDNNKSWVISPEETPVQLVPSIPTVTQGFNVPNVDMAKIQSQMMQNVAKMSSPYTATTGAKAKNILKEMLAGKKVIYRTIGLNQAASTTGEVEIDDSFRKSLQKIGINPDQL